MGVSTRWRYFAKHFHDFFALQRHSLFGDANDQRRGEDENKTKTEMAKRRNHEQNKKKTAMKEIIEENKNRNRPKHTRSHINTHCVNRIAL